MSNLNSIEGKSSTFNSLDWYRFGFNGKEKNMDDEWSGATGTIYDYGFRIYDARIARFLSVDPLTASYPWYTPYQFAGNSPIKFIDLDGLETAPNNGDAIPSYQAPSGFIEQLTNAWNSFWGLDIEQPSGTSEEEYRNDTERYIRDKQRVVQNMENAEEVIRTANEVGMGIVAMPLETAGDAGVAIFYASQGDWENAKFAVVAFAVPGASFFVLKSGVKVIRWAAKGERMLTDFWVVKSFNKVKSVKVTNWDEFYKNKDKLTITEIKDVAEEVADANGWQKVSKGSQRTTYRDKKTGYEYAVDTENATFEVTDRQRKTLGESRFDGISNKSNGHDKTKKMINEIKNIIKELYQFGCNKPNEYKSILERDWSIPNGLRELLKDYYYEIHNPPFSPEIWIILDFDKYTKGDFSIRYNYNLFFSKFSNKIYKSYFKFRVTNLDPDASESIEEIVYQPITNKQYEFEASIDNYLEKNNYIKLSCRDLDEVLCDIDFVIKDMAYFGPQPTVDMLLFKDFFGLGEDPYLIE